MRTCGGGGNTRGRGIKGGIMFRIKWEDREKQTTGFVSDGNKEARYTDRVDAETRAEKFRKFQASPEGQFPPILVYTVEPV